METLIAENLDTWSSAIKAKSSRGRGGGKKRELYGIKKLRELILELAVRGLLVPQDPDDEPASKLLRRISAEKKQLTQDKVIKKQKPLLPISKDDEPFDLPEGWEWTRLGEITRRIHYGYTAKANSEITDVRLLRITDIQNDAVNWESVPGCEITSKEATQYELKPGDILIARTGGTVGKSFLVRSIEVASVFASYLIRLEKCVEMNDLYLKVFLSSPLYWGQLIEGARGAAQPNVNGQTLSAMTLPLPPLAEQHRIVAKVDELMALCDQLELGQEDHLRTHDTLVKTLLGTLTTAADPDSFSEAWKMIESNFDTLFTTESSIDQLKQTILQLAVMGKLVEQDPEDEPASELLKKIATEKAKLVEAKQIKKQKPLSPIPENEIPFDLPVGWEWSRIGNAALSTDYGLSDKSFAIDEGVPVLAMGHIQNGRVLLGGQKRVPSSVESLPELYLQNRDLLYNRTNSAELVGKTGIFQGNDNEYTFASYLIRIRTLKELMLPEMINLNMQTPRFRETQITPHLKQQCGQANVNGTIMKNMIIAIPPLAEQHHIVAKVDELIALCDRLKAGIATAQTTQLHLADSLVEQSLK